MVGAVASGSHPHAATSLYMYLRLIIYIRDIQTKVRLVHWKLFLKDSSNPSPFWSTFRQGLRANIHQPELPTAACPERGRAAGTADLLQGTKPGGGSGLSSLDLQYHGSKPQQLQPGAAEMGLHSAGIPFAGQHDTGLPQPFFGLPWICSDAQRGRADRRVAPERDWGAETLLGWLESALCLKMRDCFVPGSLLKD